ncbi:oligopeptide/dipeptide ABC transporter, ATPase subunit [Paenibacillus vortex V453]|jgi:oligopeptide/dipeptide ABC transporter ATP-binding protein|uniref:Dipeptide/oligopeptide/nickel ABC transporter ATP-binding protein n=2 Tax=Paenibacillus TaxID=44249 RepID=A0A163DZ08_9BACL|nr:MULTISPECIES: dipeptide ABC transporter ATP-binding protein [Paenibacillus]ANA82909.1 dipeptide/oligopeptide/nickel ABC transporter ATP-binding protein [Paenibacillus glucanolyticus]AVV58004.1 dipeptide ABC transporter ATP-binding protein [Paenibacillus glucanolyticus]AWP27164.1 dipeptide/oligopeptide/nickel ABC transporter ATP-binding protein [Paenibacillus sp. Cedars]EFU39832.1 oligopeptide/dipeptide ABC transporter, ATPase subunit [Paenibacillus vortex V453]ETT34806.1 oligopeptide/dipept
MKETPLLEVRNLQKSFTVKKGFFGNAKQLRAVDGISFAIQKGETFSLVGESGCGKSTTGRLVTRLLTPNAGEVIFNGQDISGYNDNQMRPLRKDMQMVFQDPYASLNPRMKVKELVAEPLLIHTKMSTKERDKLACELLETVGLNSFHAERFAHEFSGGQRQRIGIARALSVRPNLIVADEPVSALDVSIQSQVLNLLQDLQEEYGLTYLFISHDLSVVEHISDRIGVMYLGTLVETADKDTLYDRPLHPYTQALLSSVPVPDPKQKKERIILKGDLPSPVNPPTGCRFHTRCPSCMEVCKQVTPVYREVEPGHQVACHLYDEEIMKHV